MDDPRIKVPAEQLYYSCSCGHYTTRTPGQSHGVSAHQRRTRCGGTLLVVLPEDLVLAEAPDAPDPDWLADGSLPVAEEVAVVEGEGPPSMQRSPVASGRVIPPEGEGPTLFRGAAAAPAGLYAIYDAFRAEKEYVGSFDQWLVECTELYCREVLGVDLVLQVRWPNAQTAESGAA